MIATRWGQIREIFGEALLLEESDRAAFVLDRCGGDVELAAEIHALLAADREAGGFLGEPLLNLEVLLDTPAPTGLLVLHKLLCNRFEILAHLGEGGMGQVYEALDRELRQHIAIKAIRPEIANNPGVLARFKREVYAARKINHPNVCRTFDLEHHTFPNGDTGNAESTITFLTMELLRGETLSARLRHSGPLSAGEARLFASQTAGALLAAHEAGIIHCDLKPSNVFITESKGSFRAVVTDFGIAKFILPQDQTSVSHMPRGPGEGGQIAGTPFYMAPEQYERGHCTPGSDLYSYGLILYEALTGERPAPQRRSLLEMQRSLSDTAKEPIDPVWSSIIASCLHVDPANRFTSAQQVLDLLASPGTTIVTNGSYGEETNGGATQSVGTPSARMDSWLARAEIKLAFQYGAGILVVILLLFLARYTDFERHWSSSSTNLSVAVLPFTNLNGNADLNYWSESISVALTNSLAQVSGLRVPPHSVVLSIRATPDVRSFGRKLEVDSVVAGSISKVADGLRLEVELVDVKTGAQVWGDSYVRKENDLAALEKDLSQEIAFRLRSQSARSPAHRTERQYSSVPAAQTAYLHGLDAMDERTPEGFDRAVNFLQEAVDADPQFAAAFAELANCYALMAYNYNRPEAPLSLLTKAEDSARQALLLDSTLAEAYGSLADVELLRDFNWDTAEKHYKRALQLNPAYLPAHISYGFHLLTAQARSAEARAQFAYAGSQMTKSVAVIACEALAAYFARRYDSAAEQAVILKNRFPAYAAADEILAEIYISKNEPARAITLLQMSRPALEDSRILKDVMLGIAFARMGQKHKALLRLEKIKKSERPGFNLSYQVAALYAALGNMDGAFRCLDESYASRQTSILFLNVDPLMDPLRSQPQFRDMVAKLNLPLNRAHH